MLITMEWLENKGACRISRECFSKQAFKEINSIQLLNDLISEEQQATIEKYFNENSLSWANWLITRLLNRKQRIMYAVFAAKQVLEIYEKKYPDDKQPILAIKAAERCIEEDTEENRKAAVEAYNITYALAKVVADEDDADFAACAAYVDVVHAAADAAFVAAAYINYAAIYTADAATDAAEAAAYAIDISVRKEMRLKILSYGLSLLNNK